MKELIQKYINLHKSIMVKTIFLISVLIIAGNYIDNAIAIDNMSHYRNTYLVIALIFSLPIGLFGLQSFMEKVLGDLFREFQIRLIEEEKIKNVDNKNGNARISL